jgi:hypothetical protein
VCSTDDDDNAGSVEVHYIELGASSFDSPSGVKGRIRGRFCSIIVRNRRVDDDSMHD